MRFYVGDEAGLLKVVSFSRRKTKRTLDERDEVHPEDSETESTRGRANQGDESAAETKVEVWGTVDKTREVQFLKLVTPTATEGRKVLALARKCGLVECVDAKEGSRISEIRQHDVDGSASKFVGLEVDQDGNVMTCTSTGMFTFYPLFALAEGLVSALPIRRFDTKQTDLERMRAWFPSNTEAGCTRKRVFATGGKEKEMCLWDLDAALASSPAGEEPAHIQPMWKAKNVPLDKLDMRVPVWNTDFRFTEDGNRLVVGTGYGQVRVYDVGKQRRPIHSWNVRESRFGAVSALVMGTNEERAPLHKVYLKQRLSCLAVDAETEGEQGTHEGETEDEDEDVWKGLKVVEGEEDDEGPGRQKKVTRKRKAGDGVRDKARKKAPVS